ncbi:MAG: 6-phosphogluconolactonase [Chlamydiia bacterium]|nr:6-phosphogluconolactonase [Chlamydiia bacterium]
MMKPLKKPLYSFDERRLLALPGNREETLKFATEHFTTLANDSIDDHGFFAVALSGGSTPKEIFKLLSSKEYRERVDWTSVYLFWSDERAVPPSDPESNYHMAMEEGGLRTLPIQKDNIFRMIAEKNIHENAESYELIIKKKLKNSPFDLVMLGVGEDGHTASLFPKTKALDIKNRRVVANYVPQKNSWRISFTYDLINEASHICLYVLGGNKAKVIHKILNSPFNPAQLPSQGIGTKEHPALWIMDDLASADIVTNSKLMR